MGIWGVLARTVTRVALTLEASRHLYAGYKPETRMIDARSVMQYGIPQTEDEKKMSLRKFLSQEGSGARIG